MKKIMNNITRKDGNKLGKRKRERGWLKIEFKSKMNPIDIKALAEDILERIDEKRETLVLPNFTGIISEILSMDKGMSGGDFTACCTVGVGGEQDLWRSNVSHMTMMQAMESSRIPKVVIGMEMNKDAVIDRMKAYIKDIPPETTIFPYLNDVLLEPTSKLELKPAPNVVDEEYKWDGPIIDRKPEWLNPRMADYISTIKCSRGTKVHEVNNEIFLRARNVGKSIVYPNILIPVKVEL